MTEVEVVREVDHPAETIWRFLSWRGVANIRGDTFFDNISFEDDLDEAGSVRVLHLRDGSIVREVVEELNHAEMRYVYNPLELGSLPVANYRGQVRILPIDGGRCRILISSCCDVVGVTEEEWRALYSGLENALIDVVEENATRGQAA